MLKVFKYNITLLTRSIKVNPMAGLRRLYNFKPPKIKLPHSYLYSKMNKVIDL